MVTNEEAEHEQDNKALRTYSEKEDCAGLVMWYGWTTNTYHSKHYTRRFRDAGEDTLERHSQKRLGLIWEDAEAVA